MRYAKKASYSMLLNHRGGFRAKAREFVSGEINSKTHAIRCDQLCVCFSFLFFSFARNVAFPSCFVKCSRSATRFADVKTLDQGGPKVLARDNTDNQYTYLTCNYSLKDRFVRNNVVTKKDGSKHESLQARSLGVNRAKEVSLSHGVQQ